jgi:hypothetical protein
MGYGGTVEKFYRNTLLKNAWSYGNLDAGQKFKTNNE